MDAKYNKNNPTIKLVEVIPHKPITVSKLDFPKRKKKKKKTYKSIGLFWDDYEILI